jgi:hypothetical protein
MRTAYRLECVFFKPNSSRTVSALGFSSFGTGCQMSPNIACHTATSHSVMLSPCADHHLSDHCASFLTWLSSQHHAVDTWQLEHNSSALGSASSSPHMFEVAQGD